MKITQAHKNKLKYWLPPVVWALVIFTFSSFPTVQTSNFYLGDFLFKKTAHIIEYGVLATLIYRGLINSKVKKEKAMIYAVIIASLYGVTDEVHQMFTPGRGPTVRDVVIDSIGAVVFVFGIIKNIERMPRRLQGLFKKYELT